MGLFPLAATNYVAKTGIFERLANASTSVESLAALGMSAAAVGVAGVVRVTKQYTPQQLAAIGMTKKQPWKAKVLPASLVLPKNTNKLSTKVTPILFSMDEEKAKGLFEDSRVITSVENREGAQDDPIVICVCRKKVPTSQLETHRMTRCLHRSVICPRCSLEMPSFVLRSHTLVQCRLVIYNGSYTMNSEKQNDPLTTRQKLQAR